MSARRHAAQKTSGDGVCCCVPLLCGLFGDAKCSADLTPGAASLSGLFDEVVEDAFCEIIERVAHSRCGSEPLQRFFTVRVGGDRRDESLEFWQRIHPSTIR